MGVAANRNVRRHGFTTSVSPTIPHVIPKPRDQTGRITVAGQARGDRKIAGISLGGVLVIVGVIVAFAFSVILGLIIAVVGLVAFGGFVRGKWY
jgi:hypothetical protein